MANAETEIERESEEETEKDEPEEVSQGVKNSSIVLITQIFKTVPEIIKKREVGLKYSYILNLGYSLSVMNGDFKRMDYFESEMVGYERLKDVPNYRKFNGLIITTPLTTLEDSLEQNDLRDVVLLDLGEARGIIRGYEILYILNNVIKNVYTYAGELLKRYGVEPKAGFLAPESFEELDKEVEGMFKR